MRPTLTAEMARVITDDRIEAGEHFRRSRQASRAQPTVDVYDAVTVRLAGEEDVPAVRALAEREGRPAPKGPMLVAEAGGDVLAARSLADGGAVADPFRPTAHLAELLALRTAHLRGNVPEPRPRRFAGARALVHRFVRS